MSLVLEVDQLAPGITDCEIVSSTVEIKMEVVIDTLPDELIGMNSLMMCYYIKFCADQLLLLTLGCNRHYRTGNPFKWIETISLKGETNFFEFEKRVSECSKSGIGVDCAEQFFVLDASFRWNDHTYTKFSI